MTIFGQIMLHCSSMKGSLGILTFSNAFSFNSNGYSLQANSILHEHLLDSKDHHGYNC